MAENVKRLRGATNYMQLSGLLQEKAAWSINTVGIRRIESGERRVTPDGLMAVAVALGVSPVTLMIPDTGWNGAVADDQRRYVEVTGLSGPVDVVYVWDLVRADRPLPGMPDIEFISRAWPAWLQQRESLFIDKILERSRGLPDDAGSSRGDD
ncbi:helix-turn-helix transcriptional regulator [Mycobacterium shinjukuense]|uniref:Uncharacterized protein n=1 Tax=Mycobacterium shinjukuense TaxID=398694 RepID=A0A7I7MVD6_9MYCO|nr:helix-turn-helix transcriptional regulator [Mycobacterium shinjukuense]MCV6984618.1 helix-turn-helix transcriptional regulator [Mycobacterium shinjukuense]ORB64882.1 hypothetical protein BST45_16060 [Mycobacterium shinjukuense]BBX76076.1 hypothetical protein MSHI_39820 [Mycobacterium shinjukuense]